MRNCTSLRLLALSGLVPLSLLAQATAPRSVTPSQRASTLRNSFFDGHIILDDGARMPEHHRITSNCGLPCNYRGNFFQVAPKGRQPNSTLAELCSVTVSIAGYRSAQVRLERDMVIHLKPLLPTEGSALSFTTDAAPIDAQKAYSAGAQFESTHNEQNAEESFRTATSLYPQYSPAWLKLAEVAERGQRFAEAASDYVKAQEADPRFLPAFVGATNLAVSQSDWKQALEQSEKAIRLNPVEFPKAYVFHAVAALSLTNWPLAESAAREALSHDPGHAYPLSEYVLAVACDRQNKADEAVKHFRLYLEQAPSGAHAAEASARVAAIGASGQVKN
jgi:tetratricopeptide (TPR) repeat protein